MITYTETLPSGYSFDMILVEKGAFDMGSIVPKAWEDEQPVHKVQVPDFYLGQFPVTQALWKALMGNENNPSIVKRDRRPVEMVSWDDAQSCIQKLNILTEESRRKLGFGAYRLPTEAEWEFAARGGAHSEGYLYAGSDKLKEVGWYDENSAGETQDVGLLMGNELGFYDMSGNVHEWVEDHWNDNYEGAPTNGLAWLSDEERAPRVVRGGNAFLEVRRCRISFRFHVSPGDRYGALGFRLAFSPDTSGQSHPTIPGVKD